MFTVTPSAPVTALSKRLTADCPCQHRRPKDFCRGYQVIKVRPPRNSSPPTGAAILRYLNPDFSDPVLSLKESAYGAGTKDFEHPNCVRISLGRAAEVVTDDPDPSSTHTLIQTNIDDMPAEQLGADFQQLLLQSGALDVYLTPTLMKKSRAGLKLELLCRRADT